jgi:hypothetical protein
MSILTPAAKCADREYDVAISFLVVDENIAASIKGGLSGLNVFFYPHNQEDLIGTNGIETMRAPFLSARVNVILFRERYGKTPWTGVELSAIQDSCLKRRYDSLVFVQLDKNDKKSDGLKAFREIEYTALRAHERHRAEAKERKREKRTRQLSLLAGLPCQTGDITIDEIVAEQKEKASKHLMKVLKPGGVKFPQVVDRLLEAYMLRETNVKDICVDLAKAGKIENTWGGGRRKPHDEDLIKPKVA